MRTSDERGLTTACAQKPRVLLNYSGLHLRVQVNDDCDQCYSVFTSAHWCLKLLQPAHANVNRCKKSHMPDNEQPIGTDFVKGLTVLAIALSPIQVLR